MTFTASYPAANHAPSSAIPLPSPSRRDLFSNAYYPTRPGETGQTGHGGARFPQVTAGHQNARISTPAVTAIR
jgi:hypothetical protein